MTDEPRVWVTGAGSGIGAAVARRFAAAGGFVLVTDIDVAKAEQIAQGIRDDGGHAEASGLDVTDGDAIEGFSRWLTRNGGLHHAVCCAGLASRHTIVQMSLEQWRQVVDVNLTGAFLTLRAAALAMSDQGGTITVISSIAAEHIAYLSGAHYAATKAGLKGLVRHAAFELGRRRIRVNSVAPGPMRNRMGGGDLSADRLAANARNLPLQRVVEPEDVAEACAFLASPAAGAITGAYLPVDCGFLTGRGADYRGYFDLHREAF